jgi:pimeloyl-ACP methyl ester carboxylesterase
LPEAWVKFARMLDEGRSQRARTGKPLMVPRYDIVPIAEHLRGRLAAGSVQMFAYETAQSMYDFRADEVVGGMAGRPLLLLRSSVDSVTPTEQSIELFRRAGQPTDLHLFGETDHFMFAESNTRVRTVIFDWLARYFPLKVKEAVA